MKMNKILLAAAWLSLLCSVASAQQVSVNYNHNVNFSQYHTYAWGSNNKNAIANSILAQVAQQDIEAAMSQKGLQKVEESQNPDLILTASGGEHEQTSYNAWGMRGNRRRNGWHQPTAEHRLQDGRQPVRYQAKRAGMARYRREYAEQQRKQESGNGAESCPEDVQAVAKSVSESPQTPLLRQR